MGHKSHFSDYEPVTRSRRGARAWEGEAVTKEEETDEWAHFRTQQSEQAQSEETAREEGAERAAQVGPKPETEQEAGPGAKLKAATATLKRGHLLGYTGLFLYTVAVFFRPYEFHPSLAGLINLSFWFAIFTLAVFVPSQIMLEGTPTVWTKEVKLILLLCLASLLSMPFSADPLGSWNYFIDIYIKMVIMFIVMVNVLRTERRLKGMLFLSILAGCISSVTAIQDYRTGNFTVEGYRVMGKIGLYGLFGNPDDMALHLITMIPIAVALMLGSRNLLIKLGLGAVTLLMLAGTIFSFSRGCFLGLLALTAVMAWKLSRRNKLLVFALLFVAFVAFMVLAPGNFATRIISIYDHSLDPVGSASVRQAIVWRAILVALRHPLFGVGMGGFYAYGVGNLGTHNAYLQVAADLGLPALVVYIMFMIHPLRRLARIECETYTQRRASRFYYLSVGLQASLVGYMVASTFYTVAFTWYIYYLVAYAVCLRRMYEAGPGAAAGEEVAVEKRRGRLTEMRRAPVASLDEKLLT
ncbi:MAG TPA: O-antigen ligase family protein [Pyrinomonadaceae bacterium]|jgi:O-antigen ligase